MAVLEPVLREARGCLLSGEEHGLPAAGGTAGRANEAKGLGGGDGDQGRE